MAPHDPHDRTYYAFAVDQGQLETLHWESIGHDDPDSRLLTAVLIGGIPHHLEAIAVQELHEVDSELRPAQVTSSNLYREILDHYRAADSGTDEPFLTVGIWGRQYCLFMTPYRE